MGTAWGQCGNSVGPVWGGACQLIVVAGLWMWEPRRCGGAPLPCLYICWALGCQWKVRGIHICSSSELHFETGSKCLLLWQERVNRGLVKFPSQTLVFTASRLWPAEGMVGWRDGGQEGQEGLPLPFCGTKQATALLGVPHPPHLEELEGPTPPLWRVPAAVHPTQRLSAEARLAGGGEVLVWMRPQAALAGSSSLSARPSPRPHYRLGNYRLDHTV